MTQMEKQCQTWKGKTLINKLIKINVAFVWRTVLAATVRVKLSKVKSSTVLPTFFLVRNFHLVFLKDVRLVFTHKAQWNESKHNEVKPPN